YEEGAASSLRVYGMDYLTPRLALEGGTAMRPAEVGARPLEFATAAGPTGFEAPAIQVEGEGVEGERAVGTTGVRRLALRVQPGGAFRIRLLIPRDRLAGWSLPGRIPSAIDAGGNIRLDWVAPPDSGVLLTLGVRGDEPLSLEVAASRFHTTTA